MRYEWTGHNAVLCDGVEVAQITRSWFRERADVQIAPHSWTFRSDRSDRIATRGDEQTVRYRAHKPSTFRQAWQVTGDGSEYEIKPAGLLTGTLTVLRSGEAIGIAKSAGLLTTRPVLDVDQSVPASEAVFLLWIAFVIRRRRSGSASA